MGNYFHVEVVAVECSEQIQIVQTWFQTVCADQNSVLRASNCGKIEVVEYVHVHRSWIFSRKEII